MHSSPATPPVRNESDGAAARLAGRLAVCFAALALAACGGGSGSNASNGAGQAPAPAPATQPALTITGFTPAAGAAGTVITVTGSGLDAATSATVGSLAAALRLVSATQVQVTVPPGAATGRVGVVAGSRAAASNSDFVVAAAAPPAPAPGAAVPAVTSVTPTSVVAGGRLTLAGTALDQVASARLVGVSLTVAGQTATQLLLDVPASAASGTLTLVDRAGTARQVAQPVTVLEPIVVTPQVAAVAAAGASVTVIGTGLAQVNGVAVGAVDAAITARTATALTFTVPAGVNCGAIVLRAPGLPDVNAGSVVVGAGCTLRAAAIEFAQVMSQPAGDRYQRLAAGKETWVRAFVVAASPSTPAPAVRALGFTAAGQALGAVVLAGPATLPVLAAGATVTDAMRYDDAAAFNAPLPAAWVQPGLRLRIQVGDAAAPSATAEATPLVAASGGLRIVIVPLVSGANAPTLPAMADVLSELTRKLPLPNTSISVSQRAPYALSSATSGVTTQAEWSAALSELERLRDAEAPGSLYYGMVRPMVTSGIAGIGYVNNIGSNSPSLASLGWDASRSSWRTTMVHELGHNFSRPHAPCGNVASADANYPYANGALGPTPLFDSLLDDVLAPTGLADIMGYCRGEWFSDYNLNGVMRFLEARPAALQKEVAAGAAKPVDEDMAMTLVVSGSIDAAGAHLAPLRAARVSVADAQRSLEAPAGGAYTLRLVLADGQIIERRFDPVEVDHAPGEGHFVLRLPHPGRIERVEVLRGQEPMLSRRSAAKERAASQAAAAGTASAASPAAGPWAVVESDGPTLVLRWDATNYTHASLTFVRGLTRHVLALDATGGRWTMPAEAWRELNAAGGGGHVEVSLSDGVDTTLLVIPRP